jgi:hypothetical protein
VPGVTALLLCLCAGFGFTVAHRWCATTGAQGLERLRQERLLLLAVGAFTALSTLWAGP